MSTLRGPMRCGASSLNTWARETSLVMSRAAVSTSASNGSGRCGKLGQRQDRPALAVDAAAAGRRTLQRARSAAAARLAAAIRDELADFSRILEALMLSNWILLCRISR